MPQELDGRLCITPRTLFDDSDPFSAEIYDLGSMVRGVVKSDIARAFVDLNRSAHDRPPQNPDGVVKSATCHLEPIYVAGMEPDCSLTDRLIDSYYTPYHDTIRDKIRDPGLRLCLDCHTMAPAAPRMSPDHDGKRRPAFCLSNHDGGSAPFETVRSLAGCMAESFGVDMHDVLLNDPFHGGHITRTYGNDPVPWIQVEMNRDFYLSEEWFDYKELSVDRKRLEQLNQMFGTALSRFCSRYM